jgi:N-acetylglucosamine kinase-like BadF-type ATPase
MMGFSLGFDGGGTKTDCVILDEGGRVVAEGRGGPSNPLRAGFPTTFRSLREAAAEALDRANLPVRRITGVCAGLAGAGRRTVVRKVLAFLVQEFPSATVQTVTDNEIAFEAAVGPGPGLVLIAGTGSLAYGRNMQGETARVGGYGPWVGDEGSAFDIGRRAVAAVARARDLATPVTLLSETISQALECREWDELTERTMKNPEEIFPRLFPVVIAAAAAEDSAAKEILFSAAIGLANLAMVAARRLEMKSEEFPLVKCGGVFGRSPMLDTFVDSILTSGVPRAKISRLEISPAVGAGRIAARLADSPVPADPHGARH